VSFRPFATAVLFVSAVAVVSALQTPARDTPLRQLQPRSANGISGRIVDAETNRPLGKVRVTLSSDTGGDPASTFTSADGRFLFTPLLAGRYTLVAEKTGFARARYGALTALDPPIEISVTAETPAEEVLVRLTKGAAIFGRVTDDVGDPVVGGEVTVSAVQVIGNSPTLVPVARPPAETDDLGDYRIGDLPAGRYFVAISGATLGSVPNEAPREWERLSPWVRTFYPGATALSDATPVVVGRGEEHGGVDFSVEPYDRFQLSLTISGIILGATPGRGVEFTAGGGILAQGQAGRGGQGAQQAVRVTFLPSDPSTPAAGQNTVTITSGGTSVGFNAPLREPGDWIVFAHQPGGGGAIGHVRVAGGDDQTLSLDLVPGAKVSGRVILEGTHAIPSFTGVEMKAAGAGAESALLAQFLDPVPQKVKADGTFEIPDLFGTVALDAVTPPGWTLQSVTLGSRDLLDNPLVLKSGQSVAGVQVTLSDEVGALSGTVRLPDGTPAAGCTIAAFPAEPAGHLSPRRTKLARADRRGQFLLRDLPAGAYRIAATPDIDAASWLTDDSLRRLSANSVPMTLTGRGLVSVSLACAGMR
jgi:hypothetical protein